MLSVPTISGTIWVYLGQRADVHGSWNQRVGDDELRAIATNGDSTQHRLPVAICVQTQLLELHALSESPVPFPFCMASQLSSSSSTT